MKVPCSSESSGTVPAPPPPPVSLADNRQGGAKGGGLARTGGDALGDGAGLSGRDGLRRVITAQAVQQRRLAVVRVPEDHHHLHLASSAAALCAGDGERVALHCQRLEVLEARREADLAGVVRGDAVRKQE